MNAADLKRAKAKAKREHFEKMFDQQCRAAGLPKPEPEWKFHPTRDWRFDRAFPIYLIAFEIDGGIWSKGRHVRGLGYEDDCEKMAEALLLGWSVYRFSTGQVKKGVAIAFAERALKRRVERVALAANAFGGQPYTPKTNLFTRGLDG